MRVLVAAAVRLVALLAGLGGGPQRSGGSAGPAAGGRGPVTPQRREAVVEVCGRHALGRGSVAHALQLVTHGDPLT